MDQKICLDTDASVEILKNTDKGNTLLNLIGDSKVFISTISIFELLQRETNLSSVEKFLFNL